MRKIISTLFIIFLCMNTHAQENTIHDTVAVQVPSNQDTVYLRETLERSLNLKPLDFFIYGDQNQKEIYGGDIVRNKNGEVVTDYFKNNVKEENKHLTIDRNSSGMYVIFPEGSDSATVKLYKAIKTGDQGYCKNSTFAVTLYKVKETRECIDTTLISDVPKSETIQEVTPSSSNEKSMQKNVLDICLILVGILVLIFIISETLKRKKSVSEKEEKQVLLTTDELLNLLKNEKIQTHLQSILPRPEEKQKTVAMEIDMNDIVSQILSSEQFSKNLSDVVLKKVEDILDSKKTEVIRHTMEQQPAMAVKEVLQFVTNDVSYDQSSNSFYPDVQSQHLFDIYCRGGEYFYTLAKNPEIRSSLVQGIGYYDKCIDIVEIIGNNMIVPIEDGHLTLVNDRYLVDMSSVLKVKIN